MNAIWNTIDELRSQIHPDEEEAHYQLDRLEDQLRNLETNVEDMRTEIAELKHVPTQPVTDSFHQDWSDFMFTQEYDIAILQAMREIKAQEAPVSEHTADVEGEEAA